VPFDVDVGVVSDVEDDLDDPPALRSRLEVRSRPRLTGQQPASVRWCSCIRRAGARVSAVMTETANRTKASLLSLGRLQDSAQAVAAVAGAAAGIVAFIYVLGGAVMWLRFARAGLPPDEAVAAMTPTMLLTIGVRLLVLPALILGLLAIVLVAFTRAKERIGFRVLRVPRRRLERREGRRTPRRGAPAVDPPVRFRLSARFVPRAAKRVDRRSASDPGDGNRRVFRVAGRAAAVIALVLFVLALPFSGGGLAWLAAPLLLLYWWRGFGFAPRDRRDVSEFRLAALVIAVAAFVTLARQFDDPVHLLRAKVEFVRTTGMKPLEGVFVSADPQVISIGDRGTKTMRTVRRADVASLTLGPPVEYAPNASVLSAIAGGGEWSLVPFAVKGMWCDGVRYPWTKLGDLCQGSPRVEPSAARRALPGGVAGRLRGLRPADNGCGIRPAGTRAAGASPDDSVTPSPRECRPVRGRAHTCMATGSDSGPADRLGDPPFEAGARPRPGDTAGPDVDRAFRGSARRGGVQPQPSPRHVRRAAAAFHTGSRAASQDAAGAQLTACHAIFGGDCTDARKARNRHGALLRHGGRHSWPDASA
jgi:hypothetical protein